MTSTSVKGSNAGSDYEFRGILLQNSEQVFVMVIYAKDVNIRLQYLPELTYDESCPKCLIPCMVQLFFCIC